MKAEAGSRRHAAADLHRLQFGALPWRWRDGPEILLVSSRETRRWIIPKGWPMKGRKPHAAAAREALEEAGIVGRIGKQPVGSYFYEKRMRNGAVLPCKVEVFALEVERQRKRWPEMDERTTRWFGPEEAAASVVEPDLALLIQQLAAALRHDHDETAGAPATAPDSAKAPVAAITLAPAPWKINYRHL